MAQITETLLLELKISRNEIDKALTDAKKAAMDATAAIKALTDVEKQDAALVAKLDAERKAANQTLATATRNYNNYNKSINETVGYQQRQQALLSVLTAKFNSLSLAEQKAAQGISLQKQIKSVNDSLSQTEQSLGRFQRNVGNYSSAIKGSITTILNLGAAVGLGMTGLEAFNKIVNISGDTADEFKGVVGGLKEATDFFALSLNKLDFSNFIDGITQAYKEGNRYAQTLDEIQDRQLALGLQKKSIDLEITNLRIIAKNRSLDLDDRKRAVERIKQLEEIKLKQTLDLAKKEEANILQTARVRTGLTDLEIKQLITNYNKYADELNKSLNKEREIREKATRVTYTKEGQRLETFDQFLYNKQIEALTRSEKIYLRWGKAMQILDPMREQLTKTLSNSVDVQREYAEGLESLVRLDNSLLSAETKIENQQNKKDENLTKQKNKLELINEEIEKYNNLLIDQISLNDSNQQQTALKLKSLEEEKKLLEENIILQKELAKTLEKAPQKDVKLNEDIPGKVQTQKVINEEEIATEKERQEALIQLEREAFDARLEIASTFFKGMADLLSQDEKTKKKYGALIKALAIADIGVNLFREISANNAAIASSPLNTTTGGVYQLTMIPIMTALSVARAAFATASVMRQKYEKGGYVNGKSHANGGVPIEAEGGEWIASKRFVRSNPGLFNMLQRKQERQLYADGGFVQRSVINNNNFTTFDVNKIISAIQNMPAPVVTVEAINAVASEMINVKVKATI
jgi:hypothetical protein